MRIDTGFHVGKMMVALVNNINNDDNINDNYVLSDSTEVTVIIRLCKKFSNSYCLIQLTLLMSKSNKRRLMHYRDDVAM